MKIHDSLRRRFVRNSLATLISCSFAGLIRAHGGGGGGTTTADPWGETTVGPTTEETTETWATTISTEETTSPWGEETTEGPTEETTLPTKPKTRVFTKSLWFKGYNPQTSDPIYTTTKSDAVPYPGGNKPHIQLNGAPAGDGEAGTLTAGGIPLIKTEETSIQTNESHTSVELDVADPYDPDLVFTGSREPAPGGANFSDMTLPHHTNGFTLRLHNFDTSIII